MAPPNTTGTHPLFRYISSTWSPTCPDLTPCLEDLQSTISLSPSSWGILSHTFSQNPTNPTIATVSGISKVFVVVGFKVADPTMLRTNPTKRVVRRRVAASGYQGG
jgi:hypothetical protein